MVSDKAETRLRKEIEAVRLESIRADEDIKEYFNEKLTKHSKLIENGDDRMNTFVTWDKFKWVTAGSFGFTSIAFCCLFWLILYIAANQNKKFDEQKEVTKEQTIILQEMSRQGSVLNEQVKQIKVTLGGSEITFE